MGVKGGNVEDQTVMKQQYLPFALGVLLDLLHVFESQIVFVGAHQ
jgi:hypothetical protein